MGRFDSFSRCLGEAPSPTIRRSCLVREPPGSSFGGQRPIRPELHWGEYALAQFRWDAERRFPRAARSAAKAPSPIAAKTPVEGSGTERSTNDRKPCW
jgi:hypothetical protein